MSWLLVASPFFPSESLGGEGCRASLATARDLGGVQGAPVEGSRREPANVVLVPTRSFRGRRRKFWGGNAQARYGGRGRLGGRGLGLAPALCDRGESRSFLGLASATCSLAAVRVEPDRPQALSFPCRGRDQVPSSCPSGPGRRGFTKAASPECVLNLMSGRHPFTPRRAAPEGSPEQTAVPHGGRLCGVSATVPRGAVRTRGL